MITAHECHLWVLPTEEDQVEQICEEGLGLLSEEERHRHRAMRHPLVARRFLLGRCLLRQGLSQDLGVKPEELRFSHQSKGKPILRTPEVEGLSFNLSHSGQEAVLAIARCGALGLDLESRSRGASALRIVKRFFPLGERKQISSRLEDPESTALKLWVLKESVTKAVGDSVWDTLTSVSLDISGVNLDWLLPPPAGREKDWALMLGPFREDYIFAIALRSATGWNGKTVRLRTHVLGQGEAETPHFVPELKTPHPIIRPNTL